jgi:N-methylhydantoinase B/oxoprolinase/acetone carboxylase alpha subunit
MAGGTEAVPGSIEVQVPGDETWIPLKKVTGYALPAGSLVRQRHAGGGGWGTATTTGTKTGTTDRADAQ